MKNVATVGYDVPGDVTESLEFKSNDSILGADIIVFAPNLRGYSAYKSYAGKSLIEETDSALLREHHNHWYSELTISLQHGKTVLSSSQTQKIVITTPAGKIFQAQVAAAQ